MGVAFQEVTPRVRMRADPNREIFFAGGSTLINPSERSRHYRRAQDRRSLDIRKCLQIKRTVHVPWDADHDELGTAMFEQRYLAPNKDGLRDLSILTRESRSS